jgi:hypothetical protein
MHSSQDVWDAPLPHHYKLRSVVMQPNSCTHTFGYVACDVCSLTANCTLADNARCTPIFRHAAKLERILHASSVSMDTALTAPVMGVLWVRRLVRLLSDQWLTTAVHPQDVRQGVGLHVQLKIISHCDSTCMHAGACKERGQSETSSASDGHACKVRHVGQALVERGTHWAACA